MIDEKPIEEEMPSLTKLVEFDDSVILYRTNPLDSFEGKTYKILNYYYSRKDSLSLMVGSVFNAIFTQKTSAFMVTRRELDKLLYQDKEHDLDRIPCNRLYTMIMNRLIKTGFLEVIEKPTGSRGGLYRLVEPDMVELLKKSMFDEAYEEIEKERIKAYYVMNGKSEDNDEFELELRKSKEEFRARRKSQKGN